MKKTIGDGYKTISICFSFRHNAEVQKLIGFFEENGLKVLTPKKAKVINPGEPFARFEGEENIPAYELEQNHLDNAINSDIVYIYNERGAKLGTSVSLELGQLILSGKEFVFKEDPNEPMLSRKLKVMSPKQLVGHIKGYNAMLTARNFFDQDREPPGPQPHDKLL